MLADLKSLFSEAKRFDWVFVLTMLALMVAGCAFIFSASHALQTLRMFKMQILWCLLGLGVFTAVSVFDYRELRRFKWPFYLTAVFLLIVVFFCPSQSGAHRWIPLPGFNMQPSELGKLGVILMLAGIIGDPAHDVREWKTLGMCFGAVGLVFLLIAAEPDLGTSLVLVPITILILYCAGMSMKPLWVLAAIGLVMLAVIYFWMKIDADSFPILEEYQKTRIKVFLNLANDPLGAEWNSTQSQIAVGSGGFSGKGFLKGTQNMLGFLPKTVAPTDFIFSVIAEESGFRGCAVLLSLYGLLLTRAMHAAMVASDLFGRLLAAGVTALVFCHVFVNVAMTIGVIPITGLPLPLISYGGSFMLSMMAALGLVQSVYIRRRPGS
ncbi:rod shape-determining protein RodA [Verrucomicrobiota bacterium]